METGFQIGHKIDKDSVIVVGKALESLISSCRLNGLEQETIRKVLDVFGSSVRNEGDITHNSVISCVANGGDSHKHDEAAKADTPPEDDYPVYQQDED